MFGGGRGIWVRAVFRRLVYGGRESHYWYAREVGGRKATCALELVLITGLGQLRDRRSKLTGRAHLWFDTAVLIVR